MKKLLNYLLGSLLLLGPLAALAQTSGVGIGTIAPDASAALDIRATAQGVLVPRLTAAQRLGITSPATGLLVFQTDAPAGFWYYVSGGGWTFLNPTGAGDNLGNHIATQNLNLQANALTGTGASIGTAVGLGVRADGGLNLGQNTAGNNLFLGYQTGQTTTTGNLNQFVGYQSGVANTTGSQNYFSGYRSGMANTTGSQNQFIGFGSGGANTTGGTNQFSGWGSGTNNTTGSQNQFSGYFSGIHNITGSANQFEGYQSGYYNTGGFNNYFGGYFSGYSNTTGHYNQFVGYQSGYFNTTGYSNLFSGYQSGYNNITGTNNQFSGSQSGFKNTSGSYNHFSGEGSGYSNTTGVNNQFEGYNSGYFNTTGRYNYFAGYYCGYNNTTGNNNHFNGFQSGFKNTTGSNNQFAGYDSGYFNTTGANNQFSGYNSGSSNTTGGGNVFGGYQSGDTNTTGTNNTVLGYNADVSTGALTNATALGANAVVNASNTIRLGNTAISGLYCNVGLTVTSDARFKYDVRPDVPGLAFITQLRPVTYRLDADKLAAFERTGQLTPGFRADKSAAVHTGFLAQEVEHTAKGLKYDFDGVHTPATARDHYGLGYAQFVVPLVKAVQEQQAQIDALQAENATLKTAAAQATADHADVQAMKAQLALLLGLTRQGEGGLAHK